MPTATPQIGEAPLSILLLVGASVCWYIGIRAAAGAFVHRALGVCVAGAMPALAGALWLALDGRAEAGLALAVGAAVAACTLVLGIIASVDPLEGRPLLEDPGRRLTALLLPAAVTLLVAGFSGRLTILHAVLLLVEAGFILWLWGSMSSAIPAAGVSSTTTSSSAGASLPDASPPAGPGWARATQLLLAVALVIAGAGLAAFSAAAASRSRGAALDATIASVLISVIVALPLIGVGTFFAGNGEGPSVTRGLVLMSALLLTVAAPAVVLIDCVQQALERREAGETLVAILRHPPSMPMLIRLWRIDSPLLCLAGLLLLPAAAGRFRPGKIEGAALVLAYVAYVVLTFLAGQ